MNTDLTPLPTDPSPTNPPPTKPQPVKPRPAPKPKRRYIAGLVDWAVGILVLLILIGVAFPAGSGVCVKGTQTKALAQAKQIGLALRLFASDHDGVFPCAGLAGMPKAPVTNANEAFAMLFPTYMQSETLFGNKLSAYQTHPPDNVTDPAYTGRPIHTLEPGENVYAYVTGLMDTIDPAAPLIADGTDGTGHYTTDQKKRGGVWEGKKALIVHPDDSAELASLAGPEHSRYIPRHPGDSERDAGNRLDVSNLGPGVRLLDPAVSR